MSIFSKKDAELLSSLKELHDGIVTLNKRLDTLECIVGTAKPSNSNRSRKAPISREECNKDILKNFDFAQVETMMRSVNWEWANSEAGIPTVDELRSEAERLLNDAWKDLDTKEYDAYGWREWTVATGGIEVWVCEGNEKNDFQRLADLKFVGEEWRVES